MQHGARLGVSGDAVCEFGAGTLAEVVVGHRCGDGGGEEVWLAVLVIPHLWRGRGHDRVAHRVRDGVGACVLAGAKVNRRAAQSTCTSVWIAKLPVRLLDCCANAFRWVELLGNCELLAHVL
eukprot:scaffold31419_cov69-Phaeocystis_antarctica.AAC.1